MTLAMSHIAWRPEEDREAYTILAEYGVATLEIAPGRWWKDPVAATRAEIDEAVLQAHAAGFSIGAFQAILFARPELTLFHSAAIRAELLAYLRGIARLAAACGAGPIVFGAPQQRRRPDGVSETEADEIALPFFAALAQTAAALGVYFCVEPNPDAYGTNYLTHVADAARLVQRVGSPGLRLQMDAGELALNQEDVGEAVRRHAELIGHVHISQPMLSGFQQAWPGHERLAAALAAVGYDRLVSVEMKRGDDGLAGVRQALEFARSCYGRN